MNKNNLSCLPYDVMENILKNMTSKELINLRLVNRLFNTVINDFKLISLTMPDYNYKEEYLGTLELYDLDKDITGIENIIVKNKDIKNVEKFKNCHYLNLSCCDGISDVSNLGNVKSLDLSFCYNITDISNLGNVKELDLSFCYDITDVSNLGNEKNLVYVIVVE